MISSSVVNKFVSILVLLELICSAQASCGRYGHACNLEGNRQSPFLEVVLYQQENNRELGAPLAWSYDRCNQHLKREVTEKGVTSIEWIHGNCIMLCLDSSCQSCRRVRKYERLMKPLYPKSAQPCCSV